MESFEINSTSKSAGTNKTQYKDLSLFIYNRHTHDKSMHIDMAEINFMIGINTILCDDKGKENIYKLINGNYGSLFDREFIEEIRALKEEDYKRICSYSLDDKGGCFFSGIEYYILRHLIDSHLEVFERDISNGRLDEIIKLSVSRNNLIVKVFPAKSTEDNPVSYCISLLYLVLFHLYEQVNRHVYEHFYKYNFSKLRQEKYVEWVIKDVFIRILPIVTKVKYKVLVKADDNYTWFTQLKQLKSAYDFLVINSNENQVKFLFRPKEEYLASTVDFPVTNKAPSETNYERRFIKCVYTLNKDNSLTCDTTIIDKDMVDCVFATNIDEVDEPASIYSALSDEECIYMAQYSILNRMLSFMEQHEKLKARVNISARTHVAQDKFKVITEATNVEKVKWLTKTNTLKQAFKDIKIPIPDDELITSIIKELKSLRQKKGLVDYAIVIMELFEKEQKVIDETLSLLDERTANKIKKVILKLQKKRITPGFSLNEFYRSY